jgi:hypothetical protein
MNHEEFESRFFELLKAMGEFYGKSFSDIVLEMWFTDLNRFDYGSIKKAFAIHRQNPDNGKFMPKPGDIIRILEGTSKDNSFVAWSKIRESIGKVGAYQTVVLDDPIIHRVVQDMGGWIRLCHIDEKELPFIANEFKSRYQGFKSQGEIPDYPAKLYGIHEGENLSKGLLDQIPETILIGDPEKAKEVLRVGINRPSLQISGFDNGLAKIELKVIK